MLERVIGEDIELRIQNAPQPTVALVDRSQIEQIVMNLVVNARDAMPGGGVIRIATDVVELDAPAAHALELAPGKYVRLKVTDTGCGMDAATQALIFEPFFTTKPQGKGTGLGLSTVFGIVKQSRGNIVVTTAVGAGTTFEILLPADLQLEQSVVAGRSGPTARGSETILVVEDEASLRQVMMRQLSKAGYQPLAASSPSQALEIAAEHGAAIRLIVTDVVMPEMRGDELAARLSPICPGARVLYTSGYLDDEHVRDNIAGKDFLAKPFDAGTLSDRVRAALDATTAAM